MLRVCIFGSRSFDHYAFAEKKLDHLLSRRKEDIVVVSGTARGADRIGERYAKARNYAVEQFPADWTRHGKKAGYLRNQEMAEHADVFVAFWDSESRGTAHMIEIVRTLEKPLRVMKYQSRVENKNHFGGVR